MTRPQGGYESLELTGADCPEMLTLNLFAVET